MDKKPALLLIPETDKEIRRSDYLNMCIDRVIKEGYIPLLPALYQSVPIDQEDFIRVTIKNVSKVFLYVNFGIDTVMQMALESAIENEIPVAFRHIERTVVDELHFTPLQVFYDVCKKLGYDPDVVKKNSRQREFVDVRYVYFRRAKEITRATLNEIGEVVNNGNHATVLWGIRQATDVVEVRKKYEKCYGEK